MWPWHDNIEFAPHFDASLDAFMYINLGINPLADFKRNTTQFLAQLKHTGHPVVQDAKSYQRLLDLAERLETIQAVKEGLASMNRGEGRPMDEVFDELEKELRARADA